eukprot:11214006-Lingulodinium_polyedra.AAC.1
MPTSVFEQFAQPFGHLRGRRHARAQRQVGAQSNARPPRPVCDQIELRLVIRLFPPFNSR